MRQDLILSKSIIVNASPGQVWNVLTNPDLIKEYLFGTETVTNWEKGSEIVFQGEFNGQKYKDHGTILENISHERLLYSYWSVFSGLEDKPGNYSTIRYELTKKGNGETKFTWTQQGYSTEENYNHSLSGIDHLLSEIKRIAER